MCSLELIAFGPQDWVTMTGVCDVLLKTHVVLNQCHVATDVTSDDTDTVTDGSEFTVIEDERERAPRSICEDGASRLIDLHAVEASSFRLWALA